MQRREALSSTSASRSRNQRDQGVSRSVSKENRRRSRSKSVVRLKNSVKPKNSEKNEGFGKPKSSGSVSSSESHSSSDKAENQVAKPKHVLKPPKFDSQTLFETFWAQFTNCAEHNQWTRPQKLAYLRSSLDKEAADVLWDYGKEVTDLFSSLTKTLQMRFGGATLIFTTVGL